MKIYENITDLFLNGEIWKDIEGYDNDYQISNLGRVKSYKRYKGTYIRILKQIKMNTGYLYVNLCKNGKSKPELIHILMFETFNNHKLKKDECIHHKNKNKINNMLENFKLMTKSEHRSFHGKNISEKTRKLLMNKKHSEETKKKISKNHSDVKGENNPMYGKKRSGEKSGNHILTEQDIIQIRKLSDEEFLTGKEIAEIFGVSQAQISRIKNRKRWK